MKFTFIFFLLITSFAIKASVTIGAYNIRNFDYDERYRIRTNKAELSLILKNLKADILSVEEINNTVEFVRFISSKLPGHKAVLSECGGAHGQHLGFVYNTEKIELLSFHEDLQVSDPGELGGCQTGSRPLAIGLFQIKSTKQKFYGMTAHLKSGGASDSIKKRAKQFEVIKNIITELKSKTGIKDYFVAGDFNTTTYIFRGQDFAILNKFTNDLGMANLTQSLECSAYWWGGTDDGKEDPSVLDHIIITPGLRKNGHQAKAHGHCQKVSCRQATLAELGVSYESVSDHCPITATIQ